MSDRLFLLPHASHAASHPLAACGPEVIDEATAASASEPAHVRQHSGSPWFRIDATYRAGQDGVFNTDSDQRSHGLATTAARCALHGALAWRLNGDIAHAETALRQIHAWTINQDTRMFPVGRVDDPATAGGAHRYGGDIHIFEAFPDFFLAIHLLAACPAWELTARAAVRRWVGDMLAVQRPLQFFQGHEMVNNWEAARLRYLACGALAISDDDLLLTACDRWRLMIPRCMSDEGQLPAETGRTRSMGYTLMALSLMAKVAELGHRHGLDLYAWQAQGRSLRLAIDYAAGYLLDMERWPFAMIKPLGDALGGSLCVFALAHQRWGDPRYQAVINTYGGLAAIPARERLLWLAGSPW